MSVSYTKPYKTTSDIIALLKGRGLLVPDTKEAENYINNIGYYRFSAYLYPLVASPKSAQQFKKGATFNSAVNLYRFDKKLRLLLFNEIEKIEISLRSAIANIGIKETGNRFWMTERAMFASSSKFSRTMELIDKEYGNSKEDFINHFKNKYDNPYPPAWILVEILPLGVLTRIYENIADNALRKKIAAHFQLGVPVFLSWLTVITLTRNACCHHSRIWNRQHPIEPMMPRKITRPWTKTGDLCRIYMNISIVKYFANLISPNNDMTAHLQQLFNKYPMVDKNAMGFPTDWEKEPLWQ